jgi:hypothetical protein
MFRHCALAQRQIKWMVCLRCCRRTEEKKPGGQVRRQRSCAWKARWGLQTHPRRSGEQPTPSRTLPMRRTKARWLICAFENVRLSWSIPGESRYQAAPDTSIAALKSHEPHPKAPVGGSASSPWAEPCGPPAPDARPAWRDCCLRAEGRTSRRRPRGSRSPRLGL